MLEVDNILMDTFHDVKLPHAALSADLMRVDSEAVGQCQIVERKRDALVRKIDWRIVPLLFAAYLLQFLDKVLINYGNIMGMQADLKMKGNDFSWLATAFFIGFAVAEFPQGFLLQKFPLAKVLGINIFLWGVVICCCAATQQFSQILALRTLLGCFEAVISPALIMTTSAFYTKRESGSRMTLWYCGLGVGQIIGGLISFAAQHGPRHVAFGAWRVMMIAVGGFNICIAVLVLLFLPDNVESANFLTADEKDYLLSKIEVDQGGNGEKVFKIASLREVCCDLQVWLLILLTILIVIPSGVITTFSATLIRGFGYNAKQSALLNMPSGLVSIASTLLCGFAISRRFPRWLSIVLLLIPTIIGAALMSFAPTDNQPAKLAGIYLINTIVAPLAIIYTWVGANTAGYTKRVASNALIAVAFSVANIVGPQTFQARDAPGYIPAKITIFGVAGGAMVVSILLRILYGVRNRINRENAETEVQPMSDHSAGTKDSDRAGDLTDLQNKSFVYVY